MDPMIMGTIAQGATDLTTTGLNILFQQRVNQENRRYGREMADYAYSKDLEQWERANEYNSPEQQMARLKAAGLNPRLMYPQGNPGNTVVTAPKYDKPETEFQAPRAERIDWLSTYQDARIKKAQADLLTEQARNLTAERSGIDLKNQLLQKEVNIKDDMNNLTLKKLGLDCQKLDADIKVALKQPDLMDAQMSKIAQDLNIGLEELKNWQRKNQMIDEAGINPDRAPTWLLMLYIRFMDAVNSYNNNQEIKALKEFQEAIK